MNNNNENTQKKDCNKTKTKLLQTMNKINTLITILIKEFSNIQNSLFKHQVNNH